MKDKYVVMSCAAGSRDNASLIASTLVDERLAACVQIAPIESYYRWNGGVRHEPELLLLIKTSQERVAAVQSRILELHTYDVPEITVVELSGGSASYLAWISDAVAR